ncbi:MAG: hypothetical protein PHC28_04900 [Flavobacterium sp.]|uniref:hypothetical protein n=1 Tax=Flavobacterium sp. TaxID=239 RepID=UPI0026155941|nr:hypothetical protein [Flavobacterium sp.]MDD5149804.1 hypothetical protein [Flavobacterium sp.]
MSKFICCDIDSIKINGTTICNNPVNIELCTSIKKKDNKNHHLIIFDGLTAEWAYITKESRDIQFDNIVNNKKVKNNKNLLNQLLKLCTQEQIEIYNKMYPNGPDNIDWAIHQVKNTIVRVNKEYESLKNISKEFAEYKQKSEKLIHQLEQDISQKYSESRTISDELDIIKTNNNIDKDICDRLRWLDTLEAAGVDN